LDLRGTAPEVRERRRGAVGASWTARDWARGAIIALAVAVFLSVAGAFGTQHASLGLRLVYWCGLMLSGTLVARVAFSVTDRLPGLDRRPMAQLVVATLLMSVVYTGVVWAVSGRLMGHDQGLPGVIDYFWPVLMVSAAMTTLNVMAARQPLETHAAAPGSAPARFLDRLPPKLRGAAIHAVEAQDHYLRLHTDRGSDLILMRLADAMAELDGLEGAQTHRSWWVAKDAVSGARRDGARAILTLRSGVEAPVSRTYVKALKDEGWF
jgi:DNA-binding LytR/AlgR family response regulator